MVSHVMISQSRQNAMAVYSKSGSHSKQNAMAVHSKSPERHAAASQCMVLISVNSRMGAVRVLYPILTIGGETIINLSFLVFSMFKKSPRRAPLEESPLSR